MTAEEFRKMALSLPEASEAAHMGHPDFRVGGKIFATLSPPGQGWAMVKLTPEQQDFLCPCRTQGLRAFQRRVGARRSYEGSSSRCKERFSSAGACFRLAKQSPETSSATVRR